ncbi:hypothetical protein DPEC_G00183390 [Dallia pectoralis]|uniref:Uncharacterized protein n=1 Tax=Dallia pectoralis TaxID=75939 RepID=A0ACC2GAV7_DALPE|nr:hypothetical protein DPEC_G00183390 [Dallia pectoralis]
MATLGATLESHCDADTGTTSGHFEIPPRSVGDYLEMTGTGNLTVRNLGRVHLCGGDTSKIWPYCRSGASSQGTGGPTLPREAGPFIGLLSWKAALLPPLRV